MLMGRTRHVTALPPDSCETLWRGCLAGEKFATSSKLPNIARSPIIMSNNELIEYVKAPKQRLPKPVLGVQAKVT